MGESWSGVVEAHGGYAPFFRSGASGTVYYEENRSGTIKRKLVVDNNKNPIKPQQEVVSYEAIMNAIVATTWLVVGPTIAPDNSNDEQTVISQLKSVSVFDELHVLGGARLAVIATGQVNEDVNTLQVTNLVGENPRLTKQLPTINFGPYQHVSIQTAQSYVSTNLHVHENARVSLSTLLSKDTNNPTSVMLGARFILEGRMIGFGSLKLVESSIEFGANGRYTNGVVDSNGIALQADTLTIESKSSIKMLPDNLLKEGDNVNVAAEISVNKLVIKSLGSLEGRRLHISSTVDVQVEDGGVITVDGMGYKQGEGRGSSKSDSYRYNGGSHGGTGGLVSNGIIYEDNDTYSAPINFGSGGGGRFGSNGGGAIHIQTATLYNDGLITSSGATAVDSNRQGAGGGAGGSIWIQVETLGGLGIYKANGGKGDTTTSGGGGGGIISIVYTTLSTEVVLGQFTAYPGQGYVPGGPGVMYISCTSHASPPTTVVQQNNPLLAKLPSYGYKQIVIRGASWQNMDNGGSAVLVGAATIDALMFVGSPSKLKMADLSSTDNLVDFYVEKIYARSYNNIRSDLSRVEIGNKHRLYLETLSSLTSTSQYILPIDINVGYGSVLTLPQSKPTLLVENNRTITWCGGVNGIQNLYVSDNGVVITDYPAFSGLDQEQRGTIQLQKVKVLQGGKILKSSTCGDNPFNQRLQLNLDEIQVDDNDDQLQSWFEIDATKFLRLGSDEILQVPSSPACPQGELEHNLTSPSLNCPNNEACNWCSACPAGQIKAGTSSLDQTNIGLCYSSEICDYSTLSLTFGQSCSMEENMDYEQLVLSDNAEITLQPTSGARYYARSFIKLKPGSRIMIISSHDVTIETDGELKLDGIITFTTPQGNNASLIIRSAALTGSGQIHSTSVATVSVVLSESPLAGNNNWQPFTGLFKNEGGIVGSLYPVTLTVTK
ncbi:uncharacterized protein LOC144742487 [Ciona intestinalis]